jgi:hypothetical protein
MNAYEIACECAKEGLPVSLGYGANGPFFTIPGFFDVQFSDQHGHVHCVSEKTRVGEIHSFDDLCEVALHWFSERAELTGDWHPGAWARPLEARRMIEATVFLATPKAATMVPKAPKAPKQVKQAKPR